MRTNRVVAAALFGLVSAGTVHAATREPVSITGKVVATIPVSPSADEPVTAETRKAVDRVMSRIEQQGRGRLVVVKGPAFLSDSEESVRKSLDIANRVRRYIATTRGSRLDLSIATGREVEKRGDSESVKIIVFPDIFRTVKVGTLSDGTFEVGNPID